jgi:hypothetical protein
MVAGHGRRHLDWAARISDTILGVVWILFAWAILGNVLGVGLAIGGVTDPARSRIVATAVTVVSLVLAVWGYVEAMRVPRVRRVDVIIPRLGAGLDGVTVVLLLAHQPKQVDGAVVHGVDLQISGHTHGGQIWPFHYLVRLDQPVVQGLSRHSERTQLYTSRGTGFWGPPLRVFAQAEVHPERGQHDQKRPQRPRAGHRQLREPDPLVAAVQRGREPVGRGGPPSPRPTLAGAAPSPSAVPPHAPPPPPTPGPLSLPPTSRPAGLGVVWLRALLITARTALVQPSQNAVEPADVSLGGRFLHQNMASLVRRPPGADHCAAREPWRC